MALPRSHRKSELARLELTNRAIAAACEVSETLVSAVIAGRRAGGPAAVRVRRYIARRIGLPVRVVFDPAPPRRPRRKVAA